MITRKILIAAAAIFALNLQAETLNISVGNVTYLVPADKAGDMVFSGGSSINVLGKDYTLANVTSMNVTDSEVTANTVSVKYDNDKAAVVVDGSIARYLDITVEGAHVSILQNSEVGADTCGEITYVLSGNSTDGAFYTEGSYKATLVIDNLTLTNPSGAVLDIQNGKRIKLKVTDGSTNKLTDGASGSQKGCLSAKGHLEISGTGVLTLEANKSHALYAKEYITLKETNIDIVKAKKDGLNCNQYFTMKSGSLNISGTEDDGIQVSFKDDTDREDEDTGTITINGGKINITTTATAAKAIKADGDIVVNGGEITARVEGGGKWDADAAKTKASSCMSADSNFTITDGTLNLTATNSGGKGISVDGNMNVTGGTIAVATSGGMFAYSNGQENPNYTGNADRLNSDYKSSPKGIKADGNITIDGGTFNITTKGNGGEGIESKAVLTINDGTIFLKAYDDAINSSSHMYIKGGDITVIATNNDGLDSNGNMYISGGMIRAFGASSPECGIDANEEGGYSVIFTGGTLLAVGGSNSVPSKTESTQPYVSASVSVTAGSTVSLLNGTEELASFVIPAEYTSSTSGGMGGPGGMGRGSNVLITCPGLTSGSSYTLKNGTSTSNVTAQLRGSSGGGGRPW